VTTTHWGPHVCGERLTGENNTKEEEKRGAKGKNKKTNGLPKVVCSAKRGKKLQARDGHGKRKRECKSHRKPWSGWLMPLKGGGGGFWGIIGRP